MKDLIGFLVEMKAIPDKLKTVLKENDLLKKLPKFITNQPMPFI